VVASKTHSSVTLTAVAGYEYAFAAMGAPAPTGFVGNPAFAGLSPDTGYDFYQRAAETADTNASVPARLTVRTDAAPTTTVGVTGVSLDKTALTLTAGGSETLTATVAPANATNKAVSWSSSNAGVATVSNGTVTAVSAGTATITVTTVDGGKTASCAVTVNAAPVTSTSSSDSDSGGSSGGGSDYTAQQQGTYWIEPSEAKTLAGAARGRGDSYVRTRRATSVGIRKGALAELAGLRYEHDTIADGAVQVRISFSDPAKTVKDVLVSGYVKGADVAWVKAHFEKWFKNKLRVVHLEQQGDFGMTAQIAAKVDLEGMDTKNLYFYSYDKAANIYRRIEKPAYWIDKNGYLHFETELAGDIIISEGPLERK